MKPSTSSLAYGVACDCVTLAASADGEPLDWIKLLPIGRFAGRDGRGPYEVADQAHAEQIIAASLKGDLEPVVDYDHQTDLAAVKDVGGTAPASGWIKEMQARADGIWGRIEWTDKAKAALHAREYRYFSPVFPHSKSTGRVMAILRGGLTNKPNLALGALASEADQPNGDTDLDKSKLAKALGLSDDATEDDIHAAITAMNERATGLALAAQAAGLAADAAAGDVVTAINAKGAADDKGDVVVSLQAEVNQLKADRAKEQGEAAVDAAIKAGKITPAARDTFIALHASNRAQFDAIVAAQPVIVVPGQKAASEEQPTKGHLSDSEKAICASMGWDEEAFLAARDEEAA